MAEHTRVLDEASNVVATVRSARVEGPGEQARMVKFAAHAAAGRLEQRGLGARRQDSKFPFCYAPHPPGGRDPARE